MMAIQSQSEFFSILGKSDLLDADQFLAARQSVEGLDDATLTAKQLVRDGSLTRWQAAQLLAGRSSFLLGKYKLLDLLGRGGMGRVFLGRHVTMQRQVALKIVSRDIASNPAALERFLAEARAIAALDHPAIVQAYSVDCEGDRYYIVMEYVDGRDLQRVVEDDGPLPWTTAAEYIRQAADGLSHAHGRNLVHCDIKPSNLLVNSQGQVKILDMGMARLGGESDRDEAQDGSPLLGSVDYLAPEQALGAETFDHRADLYSLGCTLYFLLTGHAPFPEGTLPERILKHQTQQPRPIPTERPDVPPALVQICRRMMAKQPEDRFQSADEIGAALAELPATAVESAKTDGEGSGKIAPAARAAGERVGDPAAETTGVSPDPVEQFQHWLASAPGRFVLGGGILLALLLVAGISIAIVAARGPAPPAPQEPAQVSQPTTPPAEREKEKPKEEDPFDLARAFAERVKAGSEEPAAEPSDGQPSEPTQPPPSETADTAPEVSTDEPAKSDSPPDKPGPPGKEPPDKVSPEAAAPGDTPPKEAVPEKTPPSKTPPEKVPTDTRPPGKNPPDKPKPAKEPQPSPLRDLGKRVPLSSVQPGAKVSLGKLHLAPSQSLRIELVGGQTAWKGPREYVIDQPDADAGPWLLRLHSEVPGAEKAIADLAKIERSADKQELEIEWLKQAEDESIQPLRNCAVAVRAGDDKAWIEFGAPELAEPLVLDLSKRSWRVTFISESLPAEESLSVQVTRIEGNVPKVEFKPGDTVREGQGMEIQLAKLEAAQVKLNLNFALQGRALRIDVAPRFAIDGLGEWPLSLRDVRRVGEQLATQRAQLDLIWKALPENSPNRGEIAKKRSKLDKIIGAVAQIVELTKKDDKTKIYYRIFTMAGERQIELWTTDGAKAGESGAEANVPANHRFAGRSLTPGVSRMPNH